MVRCVSVGAKFECVTGEEEPGRTSMLDHVPTMLGALLNAGESRDVPPSSLSVLVIWLSSPAKAGMGT